MEDKNTQAPAAQASSEFMNPNYQEETKQDSQAEPAAQEIVEEKKDLSSTDARGNEAEVSSRDMLGEESDPSPASSPSNQVGEESEASRLNFKALQNLKRQAEQERDMALAKYREITNKLVQPAEAQITQEELTELSSEDIVEGKHLNKVLKEVKKVKQQLNQTLQQQHQQQAFYSAETKLKNRYADFDDVVSRENLEILTAREPDIATALNNNPDLFSKAVTAYTMIKELKIHSSMDKKKLNQMKSENSRINNNLSKPQVAASVSPQTGDSPLSKANDYAEGYSNDDNAAFFAQMQKRSRG